MFQNHNGPEFAVCPFNARHEVSGIDFRYHVANCPDKALVEQDLITYGTMMCKVYS